jgi:predicted amidophosphoribosyltransferase
MQCPRCQQSNRPQAKFCEECATPLARVCPSCGALVSPTAKFCSECAHPVDGPIGDLESLQGNVNAANGAYDHALEAPRIQWRSVSAANGITEDRGPGGGHDRLLRPRDE